MQKFIIPLLSIFLTVALSCTYHNEEEYFSNTSCDIINVSYTTTIQPILEASCVSCHNASNAYGSVDLSSHSKVAEVAQSGKLVSVIKHQEGFSPMPSGQPKLDDCTIAKIEAWVNNGYKNN